MERRRTEDLAGGIPSKTCPVCGGDNDCDRAAGYAACWCDEVRVPPELEVWLASEGIASRCLCPRCAAGQVPSPCQRICLLDRASVTCRGCARTMDEIVAWGTAGPVERARVLRRIRTAD